MYGYNPYMAMPGQLEQLRMSQPNQQRQQSGMIWVQGEAGAKSYIVAAGNTVPLWDSEQQTVYIKSCDSSGMPSMRVLDYTERAAPKSVMPMKQNEYVTRDEFNALVARLDSMNAKPVKGKKEVTDESTV